MNWNEIGTTNEATYTQCKTDGCEADKHTSNALYCKPCSKVRKQNRWKTKTNKLKKLIRNVEEYDEWHNVEAHASGYY